MAQRTPRPGGRVPPARAAAKSKKPSAADAEVAADDGPGMGIDAGLAILTTIALIGALVYVDMLQAKFDHGMLF